MAKKEKDKKESPKNVEIKKKTSSKPTNSSSKTTTENKTTSAKKSVSKSKKERHFCFEIILHSQSSLTTLSFFLGSRSKAKKSEVTVHMH